MEKQKIGIFALILSAFCFGTLGLWGKIAYGAGLSSLQLLSLRFTVASILMWVIALVYYRDKILLCKRDLLFFALQGSIFYSLTSIGFFFSLETLKVSLATVLFFLHPVYTYLISAALLKESISKQKWFALIMTMMGIVLVLDIGSASIGISLRGLLYAIGAGFMYSLFTINNHARKSKVNSFVSTMYITTFAAIVLNIITGFQVSLWFSLSTNQWMIVLGISIVGTIIGILGFVHGIKLVGATTASVLSVFEPLSGVLLAFLFLNESISLLQILGITVILISIILVSKEKSKMIKKVDLYEF
jgi:drug/metabolite transporter (DMT)-like permease